MFVFVLITDWKHHAAGQVEVFEHHEKLPGYVSANNVRRTKERTGQMVRFPTFQLGYLKLQR